MTRATASHHQTAGHELSAAAALRILRRLTYEDWEVYRAPAVQTRVPHPVFEPEWEAEYEAQYEDFDVDEDAELYVVADLRDSVGAEYADDVTLADSSPAVTPAQVARTWYLNEVPAEWFGDSSAADESSAPVPT